MITGALSHYWEVPTPLLDSSSTRFEAASCIKRHRAGGHRYCNETGQPIIKTYLLDTYTDDLYYGDEPSHAASVCCAMLVGNLVDMVATVAVRTLQALWNVGQNFYERPTFKEKVVESLRELNVDLMQICLCGYFALGLELACFKGFTAYFSNPLETLAMQTVISRLEFQWANYARRESDLRYITVLGPEAVQTFYTPFCMLSLGNLNEITSGGQPRYERV